MVDLDVAGRESAQARVFGVADAVFDAGMRAVTSVKVPFLFDVDVHVRLLLALPLLIFAELIVHQRMRPVGGFVKRGLVPYEARAKFDAAIASAMRLRNSVLVEVLLIAFVYGIGVQFI